VAFLCTQVQSPDVDDYKKLMRVVKYLRGCPQLSLTLEADQAMVINWYVDASYAVHEDMKGHTGVVMTMGKGAAYSSSSKQKINTRSSTETELVGVNNVLGQVLWTQYFLEGQGYMVKENLLLQDNKSAMLLETNGLASSSKRTRHISIRYYFVQDKIASGEVS
jgi:hypothetical protein